MAAMADAVLSSLDDTLAYVAITRLQAAYGDAVTRRAWEEFPAMFAPECPIRLDLRTAVLERVGGAEIAEFIAESIESFEFFAFTIVNTVVTVDPSGTSARGRLYIRELRCTRDDRRWTTAYGLYRDEYRLLGGRWCFGRRDYSSLAWDRANATGMDVFPIPD